MASIRKRNNKWQVQIRRKYYPLISRSFRTKTLAVKWIRETETKIDQGCLTQSSINNNFTLKQLIQRYMREELIKKRNGSNEAVAIQAFMRQPFVNKLVSQITPEHFANYRDKRLQ